MIAASAFGWSSAHARTGCGEASELQRTRLSVRPAPWQQQRPGIGQALRTTPQELFGTPSAWRRPSWLRILRSGTPACRADRCQRWRWHAPLPSVPSTATTSPPSHCRCRSHAPADGPVGPTPAPTPGLRPNQQQPTVKRASSMCATPGRAAHPLGTAWRRRRWATLVVGASSSQQQQRQRD